MKTCKEWMKVYGKRGALWLHDNNPKRPHALLTSGNHSNGFFNSELVMEDPILLDEACSDLVELIKKSDINLNSIERVVGPAMGAITLANDIARHVNLKRKGRTSSKRCLRAYTEKSDIDDSFMVFKRTIISPSELVLVAEDVFTTGKSIRATIEAVVASTGYVMPIVAVLVNRSGQKAVAGRKIISLIDCPMSVWNHKECPLCKQGSEAIRPKGSENWLKLNATY